MSSRSRRCGLNILAVGNFAVASLQLRHLCRMLEREGASILRTSFLNGRVGKLLDSGLSSLAAIGWADAVLIQCHGHGSILQALLVCSIARAARKPVILKYYGGSIREVMARQRLLYCRTFGESDRIVVASRYVGRAIEEEGFTTTEIPHLIFAEEWQARHRAQLRPRFIYVRGFHEIYDPLTALRAFEAILRARPHASLTMVGRGALRGPAEELARDRRLPVRFLADLSQEELAREMDAHDVFLNSSRVDNQPVCLIEAMLCGMPIVSTGVGGIPDLIRDGEVGYLVPQGEHQGMAERALTLLDQPELVSAMSRRGMAKARRHLWPELGPRWVQLLDEVVRRRRMIRAGAA
jgi:glycosyltransferase involved in cell wall biosynthesis